MAEVDDAGEGRAGVVEKVEEECGGKRVAG